MKKLLSFAFAGITSLLAAVPLRVHQVLIGRGDIDLHQIHEGAGSGIGTPPGRAAGGPGSACYGPPRTLSTATTMPICSYGTSPPSEAVPRSTKGTAHPPSLCSGAAGRALATTQALFVRAKKLVAAYQSLS